MKVDADEVIKKLLEKDWSYEDRSTKCSVIYSWFTNGGWSVNRTILFVEDEYQSYYSLVFNGTVIEQLLSNKQVKQLFDEIALNKKRKNREAALASLGITA